jgi:hypothetical protein
VPASDGQDLPEPLEPTRQDGLPGFANYIVSRLFSVGLSLDSARSVVGDGPAGDRIAAATDGVDRLIRDIRTAVFDLDAAPAAAKGRPVHMARELQARALESRAPIVGQPSRLDYPAEIKRRRAFADQAEQMARRWEQQP